MAARAWRQARTRQNKRHRAPGGDRKADAWPTAAGVAARYQSRPEPPRGHSRQSVIGKPRCPLPQERLKGRPPAHCTRSMHDASAASHATGHHGVSTGSWLTLATSLSRSCHRNQSAHSLRRRQRERIPCPGSSIKRAAHRIPPRSRSTHWTTCTVPPRGTLR